MVNSYLLLYRSLEFSLNLRFLCWIHLMFLPFSFFFSFFILRHFRWILEFICSWWKTKKLWCSLMLLLYQTLERNTFDFPAKPISDCIYGPNVAIDYTPIQNWLSYLCDLVTMMLHSTWDMYEIYGCIQSWVMRSYYQNYQFQTSDLYIVLLIPLISFFAPVSSVTIICNTLITIAWQFIATSIILFVLYKSFSRSSSQLCPTPFRFSRSCLFLPRLKIGKKMTI